MNQPIYPGDAQLGIGGAFYSPRTTSVI
jgi:hypothetical protein